MNGKWHVWTDCISRLCLFPLMGFTSLVWPPCKYDLQVLFGYPFRCDRSLICHPCLSVQFTNLVWPPLWMFHEPCLATPVFIYNSCLSGTITTLLQSPSPTYMFWKGTIGLNCEWSPVVSSVVLQSFIS